MCRSLFYYRNRNKTSRSFNRVSIRCTIKKSIDTTPLAFFSTASIYLVQIRGNGDTVSGVSSNNTHPTERIEYSRQVVDTGRGTNSSCDRLIKTDRRCSGFALLLNVNSAICLGENHSGLGF